MTPEPDERVSLRHELVFTRTLPHPPSVVWTAITDPALLSVWWPFPTTKATMEVGGAIEFDDGEGTVLHARITSLVEKRVFEFVEEGTDVIRFELEAAGEGTQLTFTHRFDRGPDPSRPAAGWHQTLDALSSVLRGKEPTWLDDSSDLVAMYAARFQPT